VWDTSALKWGSGDDTDADYNQIDNSYKVKVADVTGDGIDDIIASAVDYDASTYSGIMIFSMDPGGTKMYKVISRAKQGENTVTIIQYYRVNDDGTLGELLSTEVK